MATLKEIYDRHFSEVKFDRNLCQRIIRYSNQFMTKDRDHTEFFGNGLMGVNLIYFTNDDTRKFFEDVLGIDEVALRDDFKHNAESVNMDFNVMSEPFNYLGFYIAHRLYNADRSVPSRMREQAQIHAIMINHYRFLTGLFYRRFQFRADYEVAVATYNSLSMKYDIRKYGTWRALIEARAKDLIHHNRTHRDAMHFFKDDDEVIDLVTSVQGRIREVVNKLYSAYMETLEHRERIVTQSGVITKMDGDTVLRDQTNGVPIYIEYMREVLSDPHDLIRGELVDVIVKMNNNVSVPVLRQVLEYMSQYSSHHRNKYMVDTLDEIIVYLFEFIGQNRSTLKNNDFAGLLERLKNAYTSSRTNNRSILLIRKNVDKIVKAAYSVRTTHIISAVRTAVILYLSIRTLSKHYYE